LLVSMVSVEVFLLVLPRRDKDRRQTTKMRRYNSCTIVEKGAAASDMLSCSINKVLNLRKVLFDFVASSAECSMKSIDGTLEYSEVVELVLDLIARYSLTLQRKLLRSNYKCFIARIFLSSYGDPLISKFDAPTLFQWFLSTDQGRKVISCGVSGVCFKKEIVVAGIRSVCFLTLDSGATDRLRLVVLCHTQGRDLHDFMFREGSNFAISVVDNIAVECAGLAYDALCLAATVLERDTLWNQVSSAETVNPPTETNILELLRLCRVKHFSEYLEGPSDLQRFNMILNGDGVGDWAYCCSLLQKEPAFSPSMQVGDSQMMFYCAAEDAFLLLKADSSGCTASIDIVEREDCASKADNKAVFTIQKLLNCFLFSLWRDLASW
jgi:hypothetical protein